jgi:carbon-monoxide dehydrogenase medium subunit
VADTPIRVDAVRDVLVGQEPTLPRLREAAQLACEGIEPESDVMASAEYRRAMAAVYARRALAEAAQRATRL